MKRRAVLWLLAPVAALTVVPAAEAKTVEINSAFESNLYPSVFLNSGTSHPRALKVSVDTTLPVDATYSQTCRVKGAFRPSRYDKGQLYADGSREQLPRLFRDPVQCRATVSVFPRRSWGADYEATIEVHVYAVKKG